MITSDDVNQAFDKLIVAFKSLAEIEDEQSRLNKELSRYKDGCDEVVTAKKQLADLQPKIAAGQRAYRLAGMECDRVRMLLDVEKNARGRD